VSTIFLYLSFSSVHFLIFCFIYLSVSLFLLFLSLTQIFPRHFIVLWFLGHSLYCQFTSILSLSFPYIRYFSTFICFILVSIFYVSTSITHPPFAPPSEVCVLCLSTSEPLPSMPLTHRYCSILLWLHFQRKGSNLSFLNHVPISPLLSGYFLIGLGFLYWSHAIPQAFDLRNFLQSLSSSCSTLLGVLYWPISAETDGTLTARNT
jgi:hypothetical protein